MKKLSCFLIILFSFSCSPDSPTIQVTNLLSRVTIDQVRWADNYICSSLLPGETEQSYPIYPNRYAGIVAPISFTMTYADKMVYLETNETYALAEGVHLKIVIDANTSVQNALLRR